MVLLHLTLSLRRRWLPNPAGRAASFPHTPKRLCVLNNNDHGVFSTFLVAFSV